MEMQTRLLITIDTETRPSTDNLQLDIWGTVDSGEYGIRKIVNLLDDEGMKGIFFVSVCEAKKFGEHALCSVFEYLKGMGHDLGLHVHPNHWADLSRPYLWQYNYEEQMSILSDALELHSELAGERPVAFRAGKYGANSDTLRCLKMLGLSMDFSLVKHHRRVCKLDGPGVANDIGVLGGGIIEVPVTVYRGLGFGDSLTRYERLDFNYTGRREMCLMIEEYRRLGTLTVVLCLHSYTFIRARRDGTYEMDNRVISRFIDVLSWIRKMRIPVITSKDLLSLIQVGGIHVVTKQRMGIVLSYKNFPDLYFQTFKRSLHVWGHSKKGRAFVVGSIVTMCIGLLFILILLMHLIMLRL